MKMTKKKMTCLEEKNDFDIACAFAVDLKQVFINDKKEKLWNISLDKIIANIEKVKKQNPTSKKFKDFLMKSNIVTHSELGLQKMIEDLQKIKAMGMISDAQINEFI